VEVQNYLRMQVFHISCLDWSCGTAGGAHFQGGKPLGTYDMLELYLWTCHCSPSYYRISDVLILLYFGSAVARFKKQIRSAWESPSTQVTDHCLQWYTCSGNLLSWVGMRKSV
jgi:hypothetical protein